MTERWIEVAAGIVAECHFPDYTFKVDVSRTGAVYLQATYLEPDTLTGAVELQYTRRWFLSPEMSRSEIVSTAFKCAITSMEHKTREWFTYNGRAIYQPHYDVDSLWEICEDRVVREIEKEQVPT
jgi:hypothetical protein